MSARRSEVAVFEGGESLWPKISCRRRPPPTICAWLNRLVNAHLTTLLLSFQFSRKETMQQTFFDSSHHFCCKKGTFEGRGLRDIHSLLPPIAEVPMWSIRQLRGPGLRGNVCQMHRLFIWYKNVSRSFFHCLFKRLMDRQMDGRCMWSVHVCKLQGDTLHFPCILQFYTMALPHTTHMRTENNI